MRIFVFSYNRGRYLRNCLVSLHRHAPADARVTVIDDGSADPAVQATLQEYAGWCDAVVADTDSRMYLGGLYANMQHALETVTASDPVLFIQDDMQVVRDIGPRDLDHWRRFFDRHPQSFELYGCFIKSKQVTTRRQKFLIEHETPVYFRDPNTSRRAFFSAVGIFRLDRMRNAGWVFEASEGENNARAREHEAYMGLTPYPFMMWLPNAESAKFRHRGLIQRYAEWRAGVGFHPYEPMSHAQVEWLWQRPVDELPVAEHLLAPHGLAAAQDWLFEDATKAIKPLHRVMKRIKKRQVAAFQRKTEKPRQRGGN